MTIPPPLPEVAEVTSVPEPFRKRVRGPRYALWVNLVALWPAIYFFGGAAVGGWGIWQLLEYEDPQGWIALAIGAPFFLWGAYTGIYCLAVPENRWIERRLRREIRQRADSLVDADDPEAVYVSLIPRAAFAKVRWTMASDLLLLKIDARGRQVLLEGDSDRYRIPAGAIAECDRECFFHPADPLHQNQLWMIWLLVDFPDGEEEILLSVNHTRYTPMTNARRREVAQDMCDRINELRE